MAPLGGLDLLSPLPCSRWGIGSSGFCTGHCTNIGQQALSALNVQAVQWSIISTRESPVKKCGIILRGIWVRGLSNPLVYSGPHYQRAGPSYKEAERIVQFDLDLTGSTQILPRPTNLYRNTDTSRSPRVYHVTIRLKHRQ